MLVNSVNGANSSETWLNAIKFVVENGRRQGSLQREVLNLVSVIQSPLEVSEEIDQLFRKHIGSKWIFKGADCIFPVTPNSKRTEHTKWSSNYWGRLTKYRRKVDQLDFIIRRLQSKPHSKQLSCVTFDPEVDIKPDRPYNPFMPCMIALDVKFRDGRLNLFVMFRSHDFGRKAYGNFIGLGKLLDKLSQETGYDAGEIVCYSVSAHIRAKEFGHVAALLKQHNNEFEIPKKVFKETTLEVYSQV